MKVQKNNLGFALAFLALSSIGASVDRAVAEEMIGFGQETGQINLGYYRPNFSTTVAEGVAGSPIPPGDINGEDDLGLDKSLGVARLDGFWRFADRHRLYLGYYQLDRDASRVLPNDIGPYDIQGSNVYIVAGSEVHTTSKMQVYILAYGYSLLKSETTEVAGRIGLNIAQLGAKLGGTILTSPTSPPTVITNQSGTTSGSEVTAPLPAFGLSGDWALDERWRMKGNLGAFQIKINNVKATVVDAGIAAEYRLLRNFGVGAGYSLLNAKAEYDKDNSSASLDWRTGGWQLYGSWIF